MTVIEIIDAFTFYGLDVIALAAATGVLVQILKKTALKKLQKKAMTFLPFIIGGILYAGYAALINLSFKYVAVNYVTVLEHGFSVGALSTLIYVLYEQFLRGKQKDSATVSVIKTLIDGYVPAEEIAEVAEKIALTIARDVAGDGAKKTGEILAERRLEEVTESEIKMLSRLIIETLAHLNAS